MGSNVDYTGKAGIGKRYLDEYGNFRPITELSKEVQEEIRDNARKAQSDMSQRAVAKQKMKSGVMAQESLDNSDKLVEIIEKQNLLINRLLDKAEVEVEQEAKPLTRKQIVQAEARELGIAFTETDTIAQLEKMISEASE